MVAELNTSYLKFIEGRINSYSVVKSSFSSTLPAIHRMFYIKNNYCLYDSDRILYLTKSGELLEKVKNTYLNLKNEMDFNYITLFSMGSERVDFLTLDQIVDIYFNRYLLRNSLSVKIISPEEENEIVSASLNAVKDEFKGLKLLGKDYPSFFADEVKWMKALGYTELEAYQNCDRTGRKYKKGEGPARLIKGSREREAIYKLYETYQDKLKENSLVDCEDRDRIALKEAESLRESRYTHIFLDECKSFSKTRLKLVQALRDERTYGEITYIYNNTAPEQGGFLTRVNKLLEINSGKRIKSYYFRKPFESKYSSIFAPEEKTEVMEEELMIEENVAEDKIHASMENYEFVSLKNGMDYKFMRDITRKDSIILAGEGENQEIAAKEMRELPVFSNIAAGEPIYMNPEVDDVFYLPEMWVKGAENHFLLHVKGDSMIGAGINDGDYVVIKSSPSAQNRDIVAVDLDGSATLKRLTIKGRSAVLMPENDKYDPIPIGEEGAHILGIAVGVLKEN